MNPGEDKTFIDRVILCLHFVSETYDVTYQLNQVCPDRRSEIGPVRWFKGNAARLVNSPKRLESMLVTNVGDS